MTIYKQERKLDDKFNASEMETRALNFWLADDTYKS